MEKGAVAAGGVTGAETEAMAATAAREEAQVADKDCGGQRETQVHQRRLASPRLARQVGWSDRGRAARCLTDNPHNRHTHALPSPIQTAHSGVDRYCDGIYDQSFMPLSGLRHARRSLPPPTPDCW